MPAQRGTRICWLHERSDLIYLFHSSPLNDLIRLYSTNTQLELQQRSVEYDRICGQPSQVRAGLLDYMPVSTRTSVDHPLSTGTDKQQQSNTGPPLSDEVTKTDSTNGLLLLNGLSSAGPPAPHGQQQQQTLTILDLLGPETESTPINNCTFSISI